MNNINRNMPQSSGRYILPSIEERTNQGVKILDPYSKLFQDRIVFIGTEVDGVSAMDVSAQLLALDQDTPDEKIILYINSPGGSMSDMSMIVDTIQLISSPVATICLGQASSAAAVILAAGEPGMRSSLPNGRIMIHQPRVSGSGRGQATDIQIHAEEITRNRKWMTEFLASRTGQDIEKIDKDVERDLFMSAKEAVEYGIIDRIIGDYKDSPSS